MTAMAMAMAPNGARTRSFVWNSPNSVEISPKRDRESRTGPGLSVKVALDSCPRRQQYGRVQDRVDS